VRNFIETFSGEKLEKVEGRIRKEENALTRK